jgi:hypothetical protein
MATNKPTITDIQDTFTTLVTNQNTISLDLGATGRLNTNEDSDAVSAINELELAIRGTSNNLVAAQLRTTKTHLLGAVNELDSDIGDRPHTTLTTDAKTLTSAILELDAELSTITPAAMGTTASTVSGAIAELHTEIQIDSNGNNNNLVTGDIFGSFETVDSSLGNLNSLTATITDRTDLVSAINSNKAQIDLLDSDGVAVNQTLGQLTNLNVAFIGSERTTFVNALNALRADVPLIFDENGTQLN